MFNTVRIKKSQLDYFRKKVREGYPLEIQAYLLGHVKSVNEIEITDFVYTTKYEKQTSFEVSWSATEYARVHTKAMDEGKDVLGDIHSHPDTLAIMSDADYISSVKCGFFVGGIVQCFSKKTRVFFWTPTSSLICKIVYI
jgi:proteasome lid subunit RPN8/RPN11